jgi:hypothetical protein
MKRSAPQHKEAVMLCEESMTIEKGMTTIETKNALSVPQNAK